MIPFILLLLLTATASAQCTDIHVCAVDGTETLCTYPLDICNQLYANTCTTPQTNTLTPTPLQLEFSAQEIESMSRPRTMRVLLPSTAQEHEQIILEARNTFESMKGVTFRLFLDGKLVRTETSPATISLDAGTYDITIDRSGYRTEHRTLIVTKTPATLPDEPRIAIEAPQELPPNPPVEHSPTGLTIHETTHPSYGRVYFILFLVMLALYCGWKWVERG